MALIKCPECSKNVSDKTSNCPYCGFPIYLEINNSLEKKQCPFCGTTNEHYAINCRNCNGVLPEIEKLFKDDKDTKPELLEEVFENGTVKCPSCGFTMPGNNAICDNCGSMMQLTKIPPSKNKPVYPYVLCGIAGIILVLFLFRLINTIPL